MADARKIAFELIREWSSLESPPLVPDRGGSGRTTPTQGWETLAPRDRAFAFDLVTGVIRWRNLLDAVIASRLRQPLETLDLPVRALLWLGAYQLLLQGGTADYAAVDTTVTLARQERSTVKASGLINAVLRGITRLQPRRSAADAAMPGQARLGRRIFALDISTQVQLAENIFPDPAKALTSHLAAVRSHPPALVDHLRKLYGDVLACDLLLRNNLRPTVTLRCDQAALDVPAGAGLVAHPELPRFLIAAEGWNDFIEQLVRKGKLSPQDPTSAAPVRRLAELAAAGQSGIAPPGKILDLCAGLGTKTMQLARAFPDAAITAADIDAGKLERLAARATEIGLKNITTRPAAALLAAEAAGERFDWVLVDVPCSNTGVMAKRVQSRWRWPTLDRPALQSLQRQLLAQGLALLKPGGILVYSTCSIDPTENGEIVRQFPETQLRRLEEKLTLPSLGNSDDPAVSGIHDGGYFAILSGVGRLEKSHN